MRTMTTLFQADQIQWLIALAPTVEGLARNPEMAAGEGHVLRATVKVHPCQTGLCCPAQLYPDRRQPRRSRWLSALGLHANTLCQCHASFWTRAGNQSPALTQAT